ncbi:MAG: NAD(P)/FAD-dependent oxidoreductase [Selenomonadaceae bacterium]|nr:NAD(P)/FAD-dependent oxidoreductase [Selenomonadaceae bacterium]
MSALRIAVIGGGAAGMMAAITAAENGAKVILLEKMPLLGKKMMITGKGRCNVTNDSPNVEIIKNIKGNGKFLYSAVNSFSPKDVMNFVENLGVPLKVERGRRVFPVSDMAKDVADAFKNRLLDLGVDIRTDMAVEKILTAENKVAGVLTKRGEKINADRAILAVGGASYPATGSSGDGYKMAKALGHKVTDIFPALVPLETEEDWVKEATGLSLRNVKAALIVDGKKVEEEFGEMLFAHFGITGPIILSLSRTASKSLSEGKSVEIAIDLKPALDEDTLDKRIERDFEKYKSKIAKNAMTDLLPQKLIAPVLDAAYIDEEKIAGEISKKERRLLVRALKGLVLTILKTRPIAEAIVTAGGVSVKEINPKTMESKLVKGLYFAGEVIDIDGFTGGYNLQAAFSTGRAAGYWSVTNE